MSDPDGVNLDLIGKIMLEMQGELRSLRAEQRDLRTLVLAQVEQGRRVERRVGELRDDLELMIKAELMGRLGHFETQMEHRLDALAERIPT
jgi:hypothetical protein